MFKLTEWYAVVTGKWINENKKTKWGFKGISVNDREFMNKKLPPKPNMQTQRRYCMDGETINVNGISYKVFLYPYSDFRYIPY